MLTDIMNNKSKEMVKFSTACTCVMTGGSGGGSGGDSGGGSGSGRIGARAPSCGDGGRLTDCYIFRIVLNWH